MLWRGQAAARLAGHCTVPAFLQLKAEGVENSGGIKALLFGWFKLSFLPSALAIDTVKGSVFRFDIHQANVSLLWNPACLIINCPTMPGSYFTLALSAPTYYIKIITARPPCWARAFISVSASISVTHMQKNPKATQQTSTTGWVGVRAQWQLVHLSQLQSSIFPGVTELFAEGCGGWGRLMSQDTFCSWVCDWLYGQHLCGALTLSQTESACVFCKNAEM